MSLFPSDESDDADMFLSDLGRDFGSDSNSVYNVSLSRVQQAALETARTDRDSEALAFAGALEPARRATDETTMFAVVAASVLAEHIANSARSDWTHGPTARRATASPVPDSVDTDSDPLAVGAALLVTRGNVTADEAAAIAGLPPNIIRRTVDHTPE